MDIKRRIEDKMTEIKARADIEMWKLSEWIKANPEQAASIAIAAFGAAVAIAKKIDGGVKAHKEEVRRNRQVYDHSLGRFWTLRRAMSKSDQLAFEALKKSGMSTGEALERLRLL